LYDKGLAVIDEKDGKKFLRLGKGAWYEFADDPQRATLDRFPDSATKFARPSPSDDLHTSAESHFTDYEVAPGVRDVPLVDLGLSGYNDKKELHRIGKLAEKITETGEFDPIFVGIGADGEAYVMEGQHRARAMQQMGYESVPAKVVVDLSPGVDEKYTVTTMTEKK
jgi:uncharacterized ParB-like nuclease family protein